MPSTPVNNITFVFASDDGEVYDMFGNFHVWWHEDDTTGRLIMESIDLEDATINGESYLAGELEAFVHDHYQLIQDAAWSAVYSRLQSLLLP